jgi:hypothetical protein
MAGFRIQVLQELDTAHLGTSSQKMQWRTVIGSNRVRFDTSIEQAFKDFL